MEKNHKIYQIERLFPRLSDYIRFHAKNQPDKTALIEFHHESPSDSSSITYSELDHQSSIVATKLLRLGLKKGDIILTSYLMTIEFNVICVAALKIGVIIATLDLRYKAKEIIQLAEIIKPKAYFFVGQSGDKSISEIIASGQEKLAQIVTPNMWFQSGGNMLSNVHNISEIFDNQGHSEEDLLLIEKSIQKNDPCFIIYTIGSTGTTKPALLSHDNVIVQCCNLANWNRNDEPVFHSDTIMMVNLPNSHVGGMTEQLWTTIFAGGTAVLIPMFNPKASIEAIEKYKINTIGQIPAQFKIEFMLTDFNKVDLSSLRYIIYGGAMVNQGFIDQMKIMGNKEQNVKIGTGMGLTETAGFTTYTDFEDDPNEFTQLIGRASANYEMTVRYPMRADGMAGEEKATGEVGEICYRGRQTFLGFYNMPDETAKVISRDGYFYSGDIGNLTSEGKLRLQGRNKMMIRTKGYNVYPKEVEDALKAHPNIKDAIVLGRPHRIFDEAIIAFIQPNPPLNISEITPEFCDKAVEDLAGYKKPLLFIPISNLPMNRVTKTDLHELITLVDQKIDQMRKEGGYDSPL
jgi:acyl-CoA synthetase (AMP-forming)/AMP-acid ligase II